MTPAEWSVAHAVGWSAYRKWRAENWPERECVAAAIGAALMSTGVVVAENDAPRLEDEGP